MDVLRDELQAEPMLTGSFGHRDHESCSRPNGLRADHRRGGPQLWFQQVDVEGGHEGFVLKQVVAFEEAIEIAETLALTRLRSSWPAHDRGQRGAQVNPVERA